MPSHPVTLGGRADTNRIRRRVNRSAPSDVYPVWRGGTSVALDRTKGVEMRLEMVLSTVVVSAVAAGLAAVPSAAAAEQRATHQAKKKFAVTIKASTTELVLGDKITFKGKVTPAGKANGLVATLQKRIVGTKKWKPQDTDTINKRGKYHLSDKPTSVQARQYRVVVPAVGKLGKGHSKKVLVTVYRWQDLASVKLRDSSYFRANIDAEIDTVSYSRSLVGQTYGHTGFIDYNLARQCIELKARYGLGDDSDENATALIDVTTDGASRYSRTFALTESTAKTLSLRGAFRLRFAFTTTNPDAPDPDYQNGAQAVIASPRVLCSF